MGWAFVKRAAANVGASLAWAYTVVDFALDWIGRSTADDDAKQLMTEKLPAWANWLFSTPCWVPALCALILTGWLIWLSRGQNTTGSEKVSSYAPVVEAAPQSVLSADRLSRPKEVDELVTHFPKGLYVGTMNVDASRLGSDFYLEISIQGINATGGSISIGEVKGAIVARELTDDQSAAQIDLPQAAIMHDRMSTHNIDNINQFFVVLYQRIPRTDAERFSTFLDNDGQINLYFGSLYITVRSVDDPLQFTRLPIWAGACLRKVPERILADKINMGSASLVLGSS